MAEKSKLPANYVTPSYGEQDIASRAARARRDDPEPVKPVRANDTPVWDLPGSTRDAVGLLRGYKKGGKVKSFCKGGKVISSRSY